LKLREVRSPEIIDKNQPVLIVNKLEGSLSGRQDVFILSYPSMYAWSLTICA